MAVPILDKDISNAMKANPLSVLAVAPVYISVKGVVNRVKGFIEW